jgi:hypothetical protein
VGFHLGTTAAGHFQRDGPPRRVRQPYGRLHPLNRCPGSSRTSSPRRRTQNFYPCEIEASPT